LHKDVRTHELEFFNIMESMYKNKLLRKDDIAAFSKTLLDHQQAYSIDAPSKTILDVAVLEHNMLACSLLYNNITFVQLGTLLNVSSREAEHTCSKMITGSQMKGMIDQVDGILYFGDYNGEAIVPLLKFDKEINYICTEMNELAFEIIDGEGNAMEVEK